MKRGWGRSKYTSKCSRLASVRAARGEQRVHHERPPGGFSRWVLIFGVLCTALPNNYQHVFYLLANFEVYI